MKADINELDQQQDLLMKQLEQRLTDYGKVIIYRKLFEVLKTKETIYKKQLQELNNRDNENK
ncbi:MAG: hypothetical protein ACO1NU_08605 [Arcticibacter sp.]